MESEVFNVAHKLAVEAGGGVYIPGMFCGLVLFTSKMSRSTLALPEDKLTTESVKQHLFESDMRFGYTP